MFKAYTSPDALKLFTSLGIYSEKELEARNEVKWETYSKKVQIEARVMGRMAINHIIPAAIDYQTRLLQNIELCKQAFPADYQTLALTQIELVKELSGLIKDIQSKVEAMIGERAKANEIKCEYEKALAYHEIAESLFDIRKSIDQLEELCDNSTWPLPKDREILVINSDSAICDSKKIQVYTETSTNTMPAA